jgi:6-phosphogluconolactonase
MSKIYAYSESNEVAKATAEYIVKVQNEALKNKDVFNVAVSGGSLVKTLRIGLKDRTDVEWAKWRVYFADERLVPLEHEDSNYGLLKRELLDHLTGDKPKVYTINEHKCMNESSEETAIDYEGTMTETLGADGILDLILLGCGPDGHTCSLFPGHALLQENSRLVAPIEDSPKPPPRRITITFPVLEAAKNIAFVAEGSGKAPILKEVFLTPNSSLPAAMVNNIAVRLNVPIAWFVNDAAVKGVNVTTSKF